MRTQVKADAVLLELARIGFLDPRQLMTWGPDGVTFKASADLTEDQAACVAEASQTVTKDGGTIRVKLHNKLDALDKLGRHLGLFKEIHEVTGKGGGPVRVKVLDPAAVIEAGKKLEADLRRRLAALPAPNGNGHVNGAPAAKP